MANAIAPIIAGIGGLGQMNQARNAQQQNQGYNQILAQQANQQNQMFQRSLPGYDKVVDFYSRRAGLGNYNPDPFQMQQQTPADPQQQWKPFELGGAEYHGLGQRVSKGKKAPTGKGDPNGLGGRARRQPVPGTGLNGPIQAGPAGAAPFAGGAANPLGAAGWGSRRTAGNPLAPPANTNRTGGVSDQQMGIWNNPEDRLRMMSAQDDIDRYQMGQNKQLLHNLAGRGLADSGAYGAGLERLSENALGQFADFRRNLAIGAGTEEERRVQNFMNALAPGMGFGQQSANTYGQLGAQQQQQAQQSQQALAQLFQTFGQLFGPQPGQARTPGINPDGRSNNYGGGFGGLR